MGKFEIEVFMQDGHQVVHLPEGIRLEGAKVTVRQEGDAVILEPAPVKPQRTRAELEAMFEQIRANGGADFPDREQPPMQERDFDW